MGLFGSKRGDDDATQEVRRPGASRPSDETTRVEIPKERGASARGASPSRDTHSAGGSVSSESSESSESTAKPDGEPPTGTATRQEGSKRMASMGQSIVFKGEISGDEDLEIEGQVDGNVVLKDHQLTVGANGRLTADVQAKSIIVIGQVKGNLTATERIEIQASGNVQGDVKTPRLNVQEGATLNGSIDMSGGSSSATSKPTPVASPAKGAEDAERKSA